MKICKKTYKMKEESRLKILFLATKVDLSPEIIRVLQLYYTFGLSLRDISMLYDGVTMHRVNKMIAIFNKKVNEINPRRYSIIKMPKYHEQNS